MDLMSEQRFPSTRYQGSKSKIVDWIWESIRHLEFQSALDVFGGTGCVSYKLKQQGKTVTYNDVMRWNHLIGKALIENDGTLLNSGDVDLILNFHAAHQCPTFISSHFKDIYYTDDENAWLDRMVHNLPSLDDPFKQSIAWFALFQSCIIKRPYNLFHRKNLYVRLSEVKRSFGNKASWDAPFETHFRKFADEANRAVTTSLLPNQSISFDALAIPGQYDLIYVDSPYIAKSGIGVDYQDFYHFLEGLTRYEEWPQLIDHKSKHLRMIKQPSPWSCRIEIVKAFTTLFERHRASKIVVSYRSDGIPSIEELVVLLKKFKAKVEVAATAGYQYALSTRRCQEVLLVGT